MKSNNDFLYTEIKNRIKIVADTHFFHNKTYSIYDERCEPGEENAYFHKQVNNLKLNVKKTDIFISLGDNIFNNASHLTTILSSIKCLLKYSCIGNHDKSPSWLLQHGFDGAAENIDLLVGNRKYIFCHFPPRYHKYQEIITKNPNAYIVCGHTHYDTHLRIQYRMLCLPPDRIYTLSDIDKLFNSLPIAKEVWNGKGGYISSLDFKKIRLKTIKAPTPFKQQLPQPTKQIKQQINIPIVVPILSPSEKNVAETYDTESIKHTNINRLSKTINASKNISVGKSVSKTSVETSGTTNIKKQIKNFMEVEQLNKTKGVQLGKLYVAPKGEYERDKPGVVLDITSIVFSTLRNNNY